MECKVQNTYHNHPLHWSLKNVTERTASYKFHFVTALLEVLEFLVCHEMPHHFVNTKRHTLLTSDFIFIIHLSNIVHTFLWNEMVWPNHNCNW